MDCFVSGLLIKASMKPSEVRTKLNEIVGSAQCKHTEVHEATVILIFEGISHMYRDGLSRGVFHSKFLLGKHSCRGSSSFKSPDFAPMDPCIIVLTMTLRGQAMHLKNLCSSSQKDEHVNLPLMEIVEGKFTEMPREILRPNKSKDNICLFIKLNSPMNKELCFVSGLLVKASMKPSEIHTKLNESVGFTRYEQTAVYEAIVKLIFAGISHMYCNGLCRGVFHSKFLLCKHSCRGSSCFRSPDFSPMDPCIIVLTMTLRGQAMHLKNLCSFSQKDEHVNLPLMEIVAGRFTELPQEILMNIFGLLEIPDLARVSSVCSSWNFAYTSIRSFGLYKRPQTPCLLYTSESAGENVAFLYSLAEKRAYKLTLPEPPIHKRHLIGSSLGWLVTADERSEMHLVNPITSEQISLPSVVTIEQVTPILDEAGVICKYRYSRHTANGVVGRTSTFSLSTLREWLFEKALLFYDTSAGSYIVVLIHHPFGQLSFARLGDDKWTWLPSHTLFDDCIYKDGLLYAVTLVGEIIAFDLSGTVVTAKILVKRNRPHMDERVYIVQAPWGDLLQVCRAQVCINDSSDWHGPDAGADHTKFGNRTWRIEISKVCIASKNLVEINSLDGHALFLGHNQSLCLSAEEYPQVKPNHLYLTDDYELVSMKYKMHLRLNVGILNLETKTMEEIVSPLLWSNCMAPVLIVPNLRKMGSASQS